MPGQRSNQLNYVPTRQISICAISGSYAPSRELYILPNLLGPTRSASNRVETANKKASKSSSQNYPNSLPQNRKGREAAILPWPIELKLFVERGRG
jgi:hypothetical protein